MRDFIQANGALYPGYFRVSRRSNISFFASSSVVRFSEPYAGPSGDNLRNLGGEAFRVGGVSDHVHVVTTLPRTLSQAELIEQIKKPSSKWIKGLRGSLSRLFLWQRGCAACSVSPSHLEAVLLYVQRQEEHHRTHTFQDDYRELLRRHNIEFGEQYVWD